MMRFSGRFLATMVALAIVAIAAQVAVAQREQGGRGRGGRDRGPGGGGMRGGFMSLTRLASIDKVQEALKLSDDQKDKIKKINDDAGEEMRKAFQDGGGPESAQKVRDNSTKKLNEVLNADQQKRLLGILIQVQGAGAVNDPAVAKELNITDDQKTKLGELRDENMKAMRDLFQGGPPDREKMDKFRDEANKKVMALLTSDQQKQLESLKGEKVEIDMSMFRGPGGGRPGRGDRPSRANRGNDDAPAEKKAA